jgi:hypothetical protein
MVIRHVARRCDIISLTVMVVSHANAIVANPTLPWRQRRYQRRCLKSQVERDREICRGVYGAYLQLL